MVMWEWVNALPNDEILDLSILEAFADDKLKVATLIKLLFDRVENIVGKGENAGFQKPSSSGSLKVRTVR